LRWLPDSIGSRLIMANIADNTLYMYNGSDTLIRMRMIVGRSYRKTPVFNATITYLVFSPSWTVPPGIMRNDIIPSVMRNPNYLAEKNMQVYDSNRKPVDPASINWRTQGMRYTVRQAPGRNNALGKVKFMFPNKHNVYLHDTPDRELFARDAHAFSSGCIRVQNPFELAKIMLSDLPQWNDSLIHQAMNNNKERTVVLKTPVDIYIYYLTAWVDNFGIVQYRSDIYNNDVDILAALGERKNSIFVMR